MPKDELRAGWGIVKGNGSLLERLSGLPVRGVRHGPYSVEALVADAAAARQRCGEAAVVDRATLDDVMDFMTRGGLPVSRADVVRARYAWALAAAACGTALYALYGHALLALGSERLARRWPGSRGWESAEGLLAFFLVAWLGSVVYLPYYFRFGLGRGTWLFLASLLPAVAAAALLVPWGEVVRNAGVVLASSAALGRLSLRLSVRFYEGRDL